VTIPELGTVKAAQTPIVIITSNRTREIHDALKRRCFYHWVDYPDLRRELEILKVKAPGASERLSRQVVGFVQELRKVDLFKSPGVAESIDWATAPVGARRPRPRSQDDQRHAGRTAEVPGRHPAHAGHRSSRHPAQGERPTSPPSRLG
jgi:MoxR-like ATPase